MSGVVDALVIVAVIGLVVSRQFRPSRLNTEKRWWTLPVVLALVALRQPGLLGAGHHTASAALLVMELLLGAAVGAGLAWTTRIWAEADGTVWSKGSKATAAVWGVGITVRVAMFLLGSVLGVHQDTPALLLALAATLLARSATLAWRLRTVRPMAPSAASYGADASWSTRKECV
ncbi:hypothetical protein SUDANB145_01835 [Streptomyces sp. enrichment culture]|uniref:DUF1453 domain-containing protein n=1 Tax=Streptomyces sp. enrichment culture TaxID=1795815 RepID=UPI003F5435EE